MAKRYESKPLFSGGKSEVIPSYERLQSNTEQTLTGMVGSGALKAGWTTLSLGLKILEVPRILATDVIGNALEANFGAAFDVYKALSDPNVDVTDIAKNYASNYAEVFTDTASDIFTTDLETKKNGALVAEDYYAMFGTHYEDVSPWVRWLPAMGFEIAQDPTTYIGVGLVKAGLKPVAKQLVKQMSKDAAEKTTKYLARMSTVAKHSEAKLFISDVIAAKSTDDGLLILDKLTDQYKLGDQVVAAEKRIKQDFIPVMEEAIQRPEYEHITGLYVNIHQAFGRLNPKAARAATEYVRRERSGYDTVLDELAKLDDNQLIEAGMTPSQVKALKNPISFGGRSVRAVDVKIDPLFKIADNLGIKREIKSATGATAEEILAASRKYGGNVQFYDDMFTMPNPMAHYWAVGQDLNSILKNPDVYIQNIRSANNVARAIGIGWYSNPGWWLGRVVSPVDSIRRVKNELRDKTIYKTLTGKISHPVMQTMTDSMADPLMGANPASASWWERITGGFNYGVASPVFSPLQDEATQVTDHAYTMVANRFSNVLETHGADIIEYSNASENAFAEAIQLSSAQRAALKLFNQTEHYAKIPELQKLIETVGSGDAKLMDETFETLGINKTEFEILEKQFAVTEAAPWVGEVRGMFDDVLNLESAYSIGTRQLSDSTNYFPMMVRNEVFEKLAQNLEKAGLGDLINSSKGKLITDIKRLFAGVVAERSLKNVPISYINERFTKEGAEFLTKTGFIRDVVSAADPKWGSDAVRKVVENTFEEYSKSGLKLMYTSPLEAIQHRLKRHHLEAIMDSAYRMMEDAGLVKAYDYGVQGAVAEARLRKVLNAPDTANMSDLVTIADKKKLRELNSQAPGVKVDLNTDEQVARAVDLGYTLEGRSVKNMAPEDFDVVFAGQKRIKGSIGDKNVIFDVATGKKIFDSKGKGGSQKLLNLETRIAVLGRRLTKAKDPKKISELQRQLTNTTRQRDSLVKDISPEAAAEHDLIKGKISDYYTAKDAGQVVERPMVGDTARALDQEFQDFSRGENAPFNMGDTVHDVFKRIHNVQAKDLPMPMPEHDLAISRRKINELIGILEDSKDPVDKELMDDLYKMLNDSTPGFHLLPTQGDKLGNTIRIANAAARFGVQDAIVQIPEATLSAMNKMNVSIRNIAYDDPGRAVKIVRAASGFVQRLALWGASIFKANMLGDALYAMQGGISANVASHAKAGILYTGGQGARRIGGTQIFKYITPEARKTLDETVAKINLSNASAEEKAKLIAAANRNVVRNVYVPEMNMTLGEMLDNFESYGITQSWVRHFYEGVEAGRFGADWSKNIEKNLNKEPWFKSKSKTAQKVISFPGAAVSFLCDDSIRFIYAYDAIVNRGYTMDEAATLTKQFFGDFTPLKTAKNDKALAPWFFFYRFKKWNIIQQSRVLARDPKWASAISKVMRVETSNMTDDEKMIAKTGSGFQIPDLTVARKDETGYSYDTNGKLMRSQYALYNPFGTWYSPADLMTWANPAKQAWEGFVLGNDFSAEGSGPIESINGGLIALKESFEIQNKTKAAERRMQGLAMLTNVTRVTRYFKTFFQDKEEPWREVVDRMLRTSYEQFLSLQDTINAARKNTERAAETEENARLLHKLDRMYYQLRTLKQRRLHELRPYDMEPTE